MNPNAVTSKEIIQLIISFFIEHVFTYILYSEKLKGYYIGFTATSPQLRLVKHLQATKGHTAKAKDWVLVHIESFETKQAAMAREKELKSWKSKERIIKLITASSIE